MLAAGQGKDVDSGHGDFFSQAQTAAQARIAVADSERCFALRLGFRAGGFDGKNGVGSVIFLADQFGGQAEFDAERFQVLEHFFEIKAALGRKESDGGWGDGAQLYGFFFLEPEKIEYVFFDARLDRFGEPGTELLDKVAEFAFVDRERFLVAYTVDVDPHMLMAFFGEYGEGGANEGRFGDAAGGTDEVQGVTARSFPGWRFFVDNGQRMGKRCQVLFQVVSDDRGFLGGIVMRLFAAETSHLDVFCANSRGSDRHEAEVSGGDKASVELIEAPLRFTLYFLCHWVVLAGVSSGVFSPGKRAGGKKRMMGRPMMLASGTAPQTRESELPSRLSPMTKYSPSPRV